MRDHGTNSESFDCILQRRFSSAASGSRLQVCRWNTALPILACLAFAGCDRYPTPDKVAACAAARFGVKDGTFTVTQQSSSLLFGAQYAITYQKFASTDRGVVVYNRVHGPVTSLQEISYGNHAEIKGAVEAIEYCASSGEAY